MKLRYLLACVVALPALAHETGMTPFNEWMGTLQRPTYPYSPCCGPSDQYYVKEYWPSNKKDVAFAAIVIGNNGAANFPIDIPNHTVIWDRVNPTGRGVVFITVNEYNGGYVTCFVPGVAI